MIFLNCDVFATVFLAMAFDHPHVPKGENSMDHCMSRVIDQSDQSPSGPYKEYNPYEHRYHNL